MVWKANTTEQLTQIRAHLVCKTMGMDLRIPYSKFRDMLWVMGPNHHERYEENTTDHVDPVKKFIYDSAST